MKKTTMRQKPTKVDAHLEYACPHCNLTHWLSLRESCTEGFKVVCSCDTVFKVRTIENIKVIYKNKIKKAKTGKSQIDNEFINKCTKVLEPYGFDQKETEPIIKETIITLKTNNVAEIIKACLIKLGDQNNGEFN